MLSSQDFKCLTFINAHILHNLLNFFIDHFLIRTLFLTIAKRFFNPDFKRLLTFYLNSKFYKFHVMQNFIFSSI